MAEELYAFRTSIVYVGTFLLCEFPIGLPRTSQFWIVFKISSEGSRFGSDDYVSPQELGLVMIELIHCLTLHWQKA